MRGDLTDDEWGIIGGLLADAEAAYATPTPESMGASPSGRQMPRGSSGNVCLTWKAGKKVVL